MIDLVQLVGTRVPRLASRHFPDILWRVSTSSRTVFLTFDDGPTRQMTAPLIDLLARYDVPASFFLLGCQARRHPGLVRAIAQAGHTIGNHTYNHPDAWRSPTTTVLRELEHTTGLLEDIARQPVRWMRPPYGRFTRAMRRWCQLRRQRCTMWDLGPGDYLPHVTSEAIVEHVERMVRPGSIIVLHDNPKAHAVTLPALKTLLKRMRDRGWQFGAL